MVSYKHFSFSLWIRTAEKWEMRGTYECFNEYLEIFLWNKID